MFPLLPAHVLFVLLLASTAKAFNFSFSTPTMCDNLTVTWTGGQAPYQVLLTPRFGVPTNYSILDAIPANSTGSFTTQLAYNETQKFLITMSDNTGFGTGGTSQLLTVGDSVSGTNCNPTFPATAFTFSVPNALEQCSIYTFNEYDNAVQPVTIYALIPGGESTVINPPTGPQYDWTSVDVASGTSMIFLMVDAQGRQGGATDLEEVQANTDASCLNAQSPSSTASPTSTSSFTGSTASSSAPSATQTVAGKFSIAAIAGTILGALVLLAVMITLGLFFLRKWKEDSQSPYGGPGITGGMTGRRQSRRLASVDLDSPNPIGPEYSQRSGLQAFAYPAPNTASTTPYTPPISLPQSGPHEPNPFIFPTTPGYHPRQSSKSTAMSPATPMSDDYASQGQQQKAAMAGISPYKPTRFIVHTDVEEVEPDAEAVFEVPPQYTDRRPPPVDVKRQPSGSIQRQPSGSVQRQASTSMARHASTSTRQRRPPSGNVPVEDLHPLSSFAPSSPPPSGGRF